MSGRRISHPAALASLGWVAACCFSPSAAAHAAVTNLSVYAATKGAVETLVGQLPSSSASTAPGACNGVVSRCPAIVAFCKQPEDVREAARLRRVRQRCGSRPTMRPGRGASTADLTPRSATLERASCQCGEDASSGWSAVFLWRDFSRLLLRT
jgi:hypothetical protein